MKLKKAVPDTLSKSSNKTELETNQPLGDITNQLKDVLKLPEPRQPKMTTRGTTMLPKHISGEELIRFLEEKRNKKLQEEEEKKQRKLDREQKRLQKEEERKEREKRKRKADSKKLGKKEQKTSEHRCLECDIIYNDEKEDEVWIECEECKRWAHIKCIEVEHEINNLDYKCHICEL